MFEGSDGRPRQAALDSRSAPERFRFSAVHINLWLFDRFRFSALAAPPPSSPDPSIYAGIGELQFARPTYASFKTREIHNQSEGRPRAKRT